MSEHKFVRDTLSKAVLNTDVNALEQLYVYLCKDCSKEYKKEEDFLFHNPQEIIKMCLV